jgi:hypothetical protein
MPYMFPVLLVVANLCYVDHAIILLIVTHYYSPGRIIFSSPVGKRGTHNQ